MHPLSLLNISRCDLLTFIYDPLKTSINKKTINNDINNCMIIIIFIGKPTIILKLSVSRLMFI